MNRRTTPPVRPPVPDAPHGRTPTRLNLTRRLIFLATTLPGLAATAAADSPRRHGELGMPDRSSGSLLVEYFETFLRDKDVEAFRRQVLARYTEGTLTRLAESADVRTRRATVLALGLVGSFQSNPAVGRMLKDADPTVRSLAENALWSIWFRADSDENNAALEKVAKLIGARRFDEAVKASTGLIGRAPGFAEAYNQRAIAEFALRRFEESAADCRRVLEKNPYHIGALGGLARCLLRLDRVDEALDALRRSAELQPFDEGLKEFIASLESKGR